ncbi:uncharacterized protein LOC109715122 isoform X1 [Ananas comosus]|uniref:Uncharacterized protein LOC109715122 isoform X1 n=1 Tax=Ananas comosus TaxID=4615 RepID=A0A6P5FIT8_ANACO|nr:uncharacterized protein LOC109715122 isoform X1 [Ananas comosus]
MDLNRLNLEEYLPTYSIQDSPKNLHVRDLFDISPTLTEAAGAIVDERENREEGISALSLSLLLVLVRAWWRSSGGVRVSSTSRRGAVRACFRRHSAAGRPDKGAIPPFSTSRRIGFSFREPAVPAAASSETDRGKGVAS